MASSRLVPVPKPRYYPDAFSFQREKASGGHGRMRMPFLTCIVLSHNKPVQMKEAINSLVAQTFQDWGALVVDSGVLYDQGFYDQLQVMQDRRIHLIRSAETEDKNLRQALMETNQALARFQGCLRYRVADQVNRFFRRVPLVHWASKHLLIAGKKALAWAKRKAG
jgi:glycosyltransferase involved in cell wall biosynthesis